MQLKLIHRRKVLPEVPEAGDFVFYNWSNIGADSLVQVYSNLCAIQCNDDEEHVMFNTQKNLFRWTCN